MAKSEPSRIAPHLFVGKTIFEAPRMLVELGHVPRRDEDGLGLDAMTWVLPQTHQLYSNFAS